MDALMGRPRVADGQRQQEKTMPTKKKPAKVEPKAGQAKPKKVATKKGKAATPVETPELATLPTVSPTIAPVAEQPATTPESPTVEEPATAPAEVATTEIPTPESPIAADEATPEQPATSPAATPTTPTKMSALDAAAKLLRETGRTMSTPEMITAMARLGYWTSPGGKTPHATLYSAILREITTKGTTSRFTKVDRGQFAHR